MDISFISAAFSDVSLQPLSIDIVLAVILAAMLLFVSSLANSTEFAFFSLTPSEIEELEASKDKRDDNIMMLRGDSERTLATILITINLVNVLIVMLCNHVFGSIFYFGSKAHWLQFVIVTVLLTFLLLLFSEIMPKVYSRNKSLKVCRKMVGSVMFLRKLFWFFETFLIKGGTLTNKIMRKGSHVLSVDDLEQALELTDNDDIKEEKSMLQGIIRFGDETVKEVMTSRKDIVYIDLDTMFPNVIKCIVENNYSRIPVCHDNTDNIRGVLYIKDLLPYIDKQSSFHWQSLIRQAYFVPETKKIDDLLRDFQRNKVHIAIVVDEFGGTSGMVTLDDVLEEIVGEINDEYDDDDRTYSKLNYNTYIFDGKTLLSDLCKVLNVDSEEFADAAGDSDTIAGMLLEIKGDFLAIHEKMDYKNYTFEVMDIEEHRISSVKIIVHTKDAGN